MTSVLGMLTSWPPVSTPKDGGSFFPESAVSRLTIRASFCLHPSSTSLDLPPCSPESFLSCPLVTALPNILVCCFSQTPGHTPAWVFIIHPCPARLIVLLLAQAAYSWAHPPSAASSGLLIRSRPPPPHSPRLTGTVTMFWKMPKPTPPFTFWEVGNSEGIQTKNHLKNVMVPYPIHGNLGLQHIAIHTSQKCSINYSWELCANFSAL